MIDPHPYRYLCTLLEGNPYFQEINKRRAWLETAELTGIAPHLTFNAPAREYVPEVLRAIVAHSGNDGLRTILLFLGNDADYGYAGHTEIQAQLMALLKGSVFADLKAAILAPPPTDTLAAAIAQFETLPDTIPPIRPLPLPHKMPLPANRDFVGREDELKAIAKAVKEGQVAAVVAAGIGGVGKTQLAVEWVHRYGHYFKGGVFWLDFSRRADVPLDIAAAGADYGLTGYTALDIDGKVQAVKRKWAEPTPTLLIFDNCEDPALAQEYLPVTGGARVLLTSRDQTWTTTLRRVHQIAIETLPRANSIELLRKFRPTMKDDVADGIASELGDLPLALHIAGSYLKQMKGTSFGDPVTYQKTLRNPDLLAQLEEQIEWVQGQSPTNHELSVAKTFAVSMERLAEANLQDYDLIQYLLLLIAHFAPGVLVPIAWLYHHLPESKDERHAKRAIMQLQKTGFIESPEGTAVRMHRLVAQTVTIQATVEAATTAQRQSETTILEVKPTYGEANFVAQMDRWLPHARVVAERALPLRDEQASLLANAIGIRLNYLALYDQAIDWVNKDLEISRKVLGPRHPDTATSLNNLAELYRTQGKYEAALPLYEEALGISREVLGARHPDTATSLNNLAELYRTQGKYEAALPLYEEALGISREVLGPRHPSTAGSLNNLAALYYHQGLYQQSLEIFEEIVSIFIDVLGINHPNTKTVMGNRDVVQSIINQQGKHR